MLRYALEQGLAGVIASWMRQGGKAEALFDRLEQGGLLPPDELDKLRRETQVYLERVEREGKPYTELLMTAAREATGILRGAVPDVRSSVQLAGANAVEVALAAIAEANRRAAEAQAPDTASTEDAAPAGAPEPTEEPA
jgi:hypothetical protein